MLDPPRSPSIFGLMTERDIMISTIFTQADGVLRFKLIAPVEVTSNVLVSAKASGRILAGSPLSSLNPELSLWTQISGRVCCGRDLRKGLLWAS